MKLNELLKLNDNELNHTRIRFVGNFKPTDTKSIDLYYKNPGELTRWIVMKKDKYQIGDIVIALVKTTIKHEYILSHIIQITGNPLFNLEIYENIQQYNTDKYIHNKDDATLYKFKKLEKYKDVIGKTIRCPYRSYGAICLSANKSYDSCNNGNGMLIDNCEII